MEPVLRIGGNRFDRVVVRADDVGIYRAEDVYLRIGEREALEQEVAVQRRMLDAGFPVAALIDEGEYQGLHYVAEQSLGEDTFGDRFDAETQGIGEISGPSFERFLDIVRAYVRAQPSTAGNAVTADELRRLTSVDELLLARPDLGSRTEQAFDRIVSQLEAFPGALTHGDFHAFNICEGGVIDLETAGWGPICYDAISAIELPELFPPDPRDYRFSGPQRERYLMEIDDMFFSAGYPAASSAIDDVRLCKLIWLTARRERPAHILEWLDSRFLEILVGYLSE